MVVDRRESAFRCIGANMKFVEDVVPQRQAVPAVIVPLKFGEVYDLRGAEYAIRLVEGCRVRSFNPVFEPEKVSFTGVQVLDDSRVISLRTSQHGNTPIAA